MLLSAHLLLRRFPEVPDDAPLAIPDRLRCSAEQGWVGGRRAHSRSEHTPSGRWGYLRDGKRAYVDIDMRAVLAYFLMLYCGIMRAARSSSRKSRISSPILPVRLRAPESGGINAMWQLRWERALSSTQGNSLTPSYTHTHAHTHTHTYIYIHSHTQARAIHECMFISTRRDFSYNTGSRARFRRSMCPVSIESTHTVTALFALMMSPNSGFRLAPPTRKPSMSFSCARARQLPPLTEPP